jgi:RNA polymerase sigma factor (TIGR02999 family)
MPGFEAIGDVTGLLRAWARGDDRGGDRLFGLVYRHLRALAAGAMRRERSNHTLQPTALVHEAFMRLVRQRVAWNDRAHFYALAAQAMRRVLVDHARRRRTRTRTALVLAAEPLGEAAAEPLVDVLALEHALRRLEEFDPRQARIVELRFFGGLSIEEVSAVVGISAATIKRDWALARAWLHRELTSPGRRSPGHDA